MRPLYPAASILTLLVAQGAVAGSPALWSTETLFSPAAQTPHPALIAQAKQPTPVAKTTPAQSQTPAAQPSPESQPAEKTETMNIENWILTCREFVDGPKRRTCAMTVAVRKTDTNRTVLSWTVRQTDKGQFVSVIETLPGISITPGIQLKLEHGLAPRKVPIEICEPNWCSGSLPMDKAFIQEVSASSKVTVVVTSSAGQPFTVEFPIKGFDKAYAKM